ncbi:UNVERIFIED_CONTAM: hypothetical protein FKN15_012745 [Acipenser sinensis]
MGIEILLLLVLTAFSVYFLFVQRKHPNYPPCIRGWIPWFGAAFQFGKAPLDFLAQARAKYGPVFTIAAAGKRLTFVTLHEDFNTFFMSKDVDFQQAVQDPVQRTALAMGIEILLLLVLTAFSVYFLFVQRKHPNYPPCIRGWIPWFGAAFQFGKAPLDFLAQARAKYGPVFTIAAAGKRLTFVTLHEDFNTFFMSKDVDFQQAVQDPVQRTASISKESFFKNHPACHALIKGRLTRSNLHQVSSDLCAEFNEHLELLTDEGAGDLSDLVRHIMYPAVMSNLLGKCNSPASKAAVQEFTEQFQTYDEGFEYGSQLPELCLR